jgi:Rv0078B-related antitoxin
MSDTSPAAQAVQDEIHRRMTGEERLKLAFEMSEMARNLALSRLRKEHPDWTEWELKRELLRYAFGKQPWPEILR